MSIFSRLNFARRLYNRDVPLAALDKDITAVTDIADPGERLLRYDELAHRAAKMRDSIEGPVLVPSTFSFVGAGLLILFGAVTAQPWIMVAGLTLMGASLASLYAATQVGADSRAALKVRSESCKAAAREILGYTPPLAFARSPGFEKVVHKFPELRESFLLALARENLTPPASLAPAVAQSALKL
jgi:hypothetical protein